jgi:hypothetical protein
MVFYLQIDDAVAVKGKRGGSSPRNKKEPAPVWGLALVIRLGSPG